MKGGRHERREYHPFELLFTCTRETEHIPSEPSKTHFGKDMSMKVVDTEAITHFDEEAEIPINLTPDEPEDLLKWMSIITGKVGQMMTVNDS